MKLHLTRVGLLVLIGGEWGVAGCLWAPGIRSAPERHVAIPRAGASADPVAPAEHARLQSAPALIGTLRTRDHSIHIYAGRFTVEDAEGGMMAELVTKSELAQLLPDVFDQVKAMLAEGQRHAGDWVQDDTLFHESTHGGSTSTVYLLDEP